MSLIMTSQTEARYSVVPGKAEHAKAIANVSKEAYAEDIVSRNLNACIDPEVLRVRSEQRLVDAFTQAHLTGMHYVVAVENETGNVVGFMAYTLPITLTAAQKEERQAFLDAQKSVPPPNGANTALEAAFFSQGAEYRAKYFNSEKDIYLQTLAVIPTQSRRGIASMLLKQLLPVADDLKANICLIASPSGLPVYLRHAWERVEEITFDFSKYGSEDGPASAPFMIRKPAA